MNDELLQIHDGIEIYNHVLISFAGLEGVHIMRWGGLGHHCEDEGER